MNAQAGIPDEGPASPCADPAAVRDHVDMLHDLARRSGTAGVLVLCSYGEDPASGRSLSPRVAHFDIGDVDGMVAAALAMAAEPHRNVYAPWAILSQDLTVGGRSKREDIRAVLALMVDLDADNGRGEMPLPCPAPYVLESSEGNFQPVYPLIRALTVAESEPVARSLAACFGGDGATKDVAHVWRVAGTPNWPNAAKLRRGRPATPQLVKVATPWSGRTVDGGALLKACHGTTGGERGSGKLFGLDIDLASVSLVSDVDRAAVIAELRCRDNALTRDEWVRLTLAVKETCGETEEAREAWLDFSARWPDQKPGEPERVWETARPTGGVGVGTAMHLLRTQVLRGDGAGAGGTAGAGVPAKAPARESGYCGLLPARDFMARMRPPSYLVDGVLQRGMLHTIMGLTGHGKTTAALLIAACIVTGEPFCGLEVRKGSVLFLAGENPDNVRTQWHALCAYLRIPPDIEGMYWHEGSFALSAPTEPLMADAAATPDLRLIIGDTLQGFFFGEDDNANPEMLAAARDFRALTRLESRPTVLVPAHPTKSAGKDGLVPRGGSAFLNEIDGNLTIWTQDGVARLHTQGKHRGAEFEAIKLEMIRIEPPGLEDEKGRQMPATVARPLLMLREEEIVKRAMTNEDRALAAIHSNSIISKHGLADALGVSPSSAFRVIVRLREKFKRIKREGHGHVLTRSGKAALDHSRGAR